jgi:hypothetical protein
MTSDDDHYASYIESARQTQGGHLHIGRGGFTLHFGSSRLSGYDCERTKSRCVTAGLPVIDSRPVSFEVVAKLAVSGPMIAVNAAADPRPWHAPWCGRCRLSARRRRSLQRSRGWLRRARFCQPAGQHARSGDRRLARLRPPRGNRKGLNDER